MLLILVLKFILNNALRFVFSTTILYEDKDEILSNDEIVEVGSKKTGKEDENEITLFTEAIDPCNNREPMISINEDRYGSYKDYLNICGINEDFLNEVNLLSEGSNDLTESKEDKNSITNQS